MKVIELKPNGEIIELENFDDCIEIPEGCAACGGNYPECADSCPIFGE